MKNETILQEVEKELRAAKWKKLAGFFYKEINDTTIAHFNVFLKGTVLRAQAGVTNRQLNRVSWDLHGIPQEFGTLKEQLVNSSKCSLYFAYVAEEFDDLSDAKKIAETIGTLCLDNANEYSSLAKINARLDGLSPEQQKQYLVDRLCLAFAQNHLPSLEAIIDEGKRRESASETSIFVHAEKLMSKAS